MVSLSKGLQGERGLTGLPGDKGEPVRSPAVLAEGWPLSGRWGEAFLNHSALIQKGWERQRKGLHTPQMDGAGCPCGPYTLGAVCVLALSYHFGGGGSSPSLIPHTCVPACSSPPHSGPPFPRSAPRVLGLVTWAWEMAHNSNCTWGVGGLGGGWAPAG